MYVCMFTHDSHDEYCEKKERGREKGMEVIKQNKVEKKAYNTRMIKLNL
jgi:hypothetical protein